jgi:hypothetical protein
MWILVVNFYVHKWFWGKARLASKKSGEKCKVIDAEKNKDRFFELHILVDELTKDVSLLVVDFAERVKRRIMGESFKHQ